MIKKEKFNMENKTIYEIIQDFIFLYFLVLIESETDDVELRSVLDSINGLFVSIFSHELIISKYCDKKDFDANDLSIIRSIRTFYLKNPPNVNGKLIKELKNSTKVDFNHFIFDNVITVDKSNSNDLICINFSDFVFRNRYNNNLSNQISRIPKTVLEAFLKGIGIDNSELYDSIKPFSKNITENISKKFSLKRYSYSTFIMFKSSGLTDEEKYYILYRYNFVKFALIIKKLQPISINISVPISIDTNITYKKIKALAIETIYNDMKSLDSLPIIKKIKKSISNNIKDISFFSTNRKMRNNTHYNKKENISKEELSLLDRYQDIYLKTILDIFNENIKISLNRNYKFWKWVAEKTDSNFKEKTKKSDYNLINFKDTFNRDF